eukprot:6447636-Prymnesium_polylepis.1
MPSTSSPDRKCDVHSRAMSEESNWWRSRKAVLSSLSVRSAASCSPCDVYAVSVYDSIARHGSWLPALAEKKGASTAFEIACSRWLSASAQSSVAAVEVWAARGCLHSRLTSHEVISGSSRHAIRGSSWEGTSSRGGGASSASRCAAGTGASDANSSRSISSTSLIDAMSPTTAAAMRWSLYHLE